jgi:NADPH-dependent 2,4-dienoyl-CoA reductase/sulfur reductase-like enzyme
LKEKPESLAIIGGGPIGCELGQMFSRLGVRVTILQKGPRPARQGRFAGERIGACNPRDRRNTSADQRRDRRSQANGERRLPALLRPEYLEQRVARLSRPSA